MIEGENLTADDLGPLGRLVAPGEMLVLEPRDVKLVRREREWISHLYSKADEKAEKLRRRLGAARLGMHGDAVRDWFEAWTVEAAKLSLCDRYLRAIESQLEADRQQAVAPNASFRWHTQDKIREVAQRVAGAADSEIEGGAVFRAQ